MIKTISLLLSLFVLSTVACDRSTAPTSPAADAADESVATSQSLSSGGTITPPCCVFHTGGFSISSLTCGPSVPVTTLNFSNLCRLRCLPFTYWC